MERVRFGSDGNGVFVAIRCSPDDARETRWQIVDSKAFARMRFRFDVLTPAELRRVEEHFGFYPIPAVG